jgi:hypothetical protein
MSGRPRRGDGDLRRLVVLLTPAVVPVSMAAVFAALSRRLPARTAYNAGFAIYWVGWCTGLPLCVLGPRRALRVLASGRRPTTAEAGALLLPVLGALATELVPRRRLIDGRVLATMVGTAAVNATTEELLWRGMFLEVFPDDPVRGALWPLAGFSLWHLAPQIVLPSRHGRAGFVLGRGRGSGLGPGLLAVPRPAVGAAPAHRHRRLRGESGLLPAGHGERNDGRRERWCTVNQAEVLDGQVRQPRKGEVFGPLIEREGVTLLPVVRVRRWGSPRAVGAWVVRDGRRTGSRRST